jgi:HK97 family phage portal protein
VSIIRRTVAPSSRRDISTYPWTNGTTVPTNLQSGVAGYNYQTADAMRVAAVVACIGLRSGAFAQLPLKAYREQADGTGVVIRPQPLLMDNPTTDVVPSVWKIQMSISRDIWGYAAGLISAVDGSGSPAKVDWVVPDRLTARNDYDNGPLVWRLDGQPIDATRVFHVPSRWVVPGRPVGMSPLEKSGLVDLAMRAQEFGRDWFRHGAIPSSVIYSDAMIDQKQGDELVATMQSRWRRRSPAIIGSGMKYEQISVAANESQFLDTMMKAASDIAISFNLPPGKIAAQMSGSDVKYTNVEQSTQQYLMDSINPDLVVIQDVFTRALPPGVYARWETGAFLRSDIKTRYESYAIGLASGFLSVDEVRAKEELGPMEQQPQGVTP